MKRKGSKKMETLQPKMIEAMRSYSKKQFVKDLISGIIVAIIALPLSIALAIASGVTPECGLYTAIIAGFFISLLGGSRVQIGGPTAAFVVIIYGIVQEYKMSGLIVATIMSGIFLVIMGICRLGTLIKFIPYTITTGFTCGIGVTLFVGQIKDFLGLDMGEVPSEFVEKIEAYAKNISTTNLTTLVVGALALVILIGLPMITDKIPASLVAIIVTTLVVKYANLEVNTIGSVFGELSSKLPTPHVSGITFAMIRKLISPAFTIALLAAIESLLSCVVSDSMIGDTHNSNAELIGQGVGNVFSGIFGGIPATGAIARTAANVKNGGRTPVAGIVHCVTLLGILLALMPLAAMIPMTTLAAVLIVVAFNMCDWETFFRLIKTAPKSDILVLVGSFILTVFFDLVVAIEIGVVVSAILFMKRMSDVSDIKSWKYIEQPDVKEGEAERLLSIAKEIRVFEINGPMFFAAADLLASVDSKKYTKVIVIRMRSVPAIDASAIHSLHQLASRAKKKGIDLVFAHVNEQPMNAFKKDGFYDKIGAENFQPDIMSALDYAEGLLHK